MQVVTHKERFSNQQRDVLWRLAIKNLRDIAARGEALGYPRQDLQSLAEQLRMQ